MSRGLHNRVPLPADWWGRFVELYQERGFATLAEFCKDTFPAGPDSLINVKTLERARSTGLTERVSDLLFQKLDFKTRKELLVALGAEDSEKQPTMPKESRRRVNLAQEMMRSGKRSEAIKEMTEALTIAREESDEEDEAEILIGLALISSERPGEGDCQHYFNEAEKKFGKLKSSEAKAIYFRARAAALQEKRDMAGTEEAYRSALRCCVDADDGMGNLAAQGCIARSSFVHFLCNQKRLEEALPFLTEAEEYARSHKQAEDGELLQAALDAGIHFSLETCDEDAAIARIAELEQFSDIARLANRIGGDLINVANRASHRKAHRTALAAAEAAIRLGRRYDDRSSSSFLVGAIYTEARILLEAGDDEKALGKAEAILDLCQRPEDAIIKQATQRLIAEIRRCSGDSQTAVDLAKLALNAASGRPEDVAFTKSALARALNDNGQTEEALKQAKDAWVLARPAGIPVEYAVELLSQITNYGSQLGAENDVLEAITALEGLHDGSDKVKANTKRAVARASANRKLRQRFLEVLQEADPGKVAGTIKSLSLQEANAAVVRPLLHLWEETPECLATCYDFWGRGNFERILLNTRSFSNCFNITVEVRSLDDVKRAIRLWGLYADFLILLWKGPTANELTIMPFPDDYKDPGGWGYMICTGDTLKKEGSNKKWYPAMAHISALPDDVAAFLATEARPFIESGRLLVVPAVGAGCVNPGHGPFEQLLAEAASAIPSIRWKRFEAPPIGFIPHSPNAPFKLIAELAEAESSRLRKLRLLLLKRSRDLQPDGSMGIEAKILSLEIVDALRDMEDRNTAFARKKGLDKAKEPLSGTTARFRSSGKKLTSMTPDSPFAPLLILQNLGYGWRVDSPQVPKLPKRFEPGEGDAIGTWLAPPSAGWMIPTVVRTTSEAF